jgi:hypothetical protein
MLVRHPRSQLVATGRGYCSRVIAALSRTRATGQSMALHEMREPLGEGGHRDAWRRRCQAGRCEAPGAQPIDLTVSHLAAAEPRGVLMEVAGRRRASDGSRPRFRHPRHVAPSSRHVRVRGLRRGDIPRRGGRHRRWGAPGRERRSRPALLPIWPVAAVARGARAGAGGAVSRRGARRAGPSTGSYVRKRLGEG